MKRKTLSTLVVVLFFGLAIAPSIYANVDRVSLNDVYDKNLDRLEIGNIVLKLFLGNMRLVFLLLLPLQLRNI